MSETSYGFWPLSAALSWMADDTMYALAMAGSGVGPEAYETIPPRMSRAPQDQMEAYEQATYFVALAARRAAQLEDDGAIGPGTKKFLQAQLDTMGREAEAAKADTNFVCSTTGYMCPVRGSGQVLADTIQIIDDSTLPEEERVRMTTILRKSRRAVMLRQAIPWVVAIGLGGAGAYYWYSKRT